VRRFENMICDYDIGRLSSTFITDEMLDITITIGTRWPFPHYRRLFCLCFESPLSHLFDIQPPSKVIAHNMSDKRYTTRSSSKADAVLPYHITDVLEQVKTKVASICSVNEVTEKKINALTAYLDEAPTEVGLAIVSFYVCAAIHDSVYKGNQK